jgi:hypothetical protein
MYYSIPSKKGKNLYSSFDFVLFWFFPFCVSEMIYRTSQDDPYHIDFPFAITTGGRFSVFLTIYFA